ncbi:prepilin peptidase [Verrucomicrobiota bacterium]
MSELFLPPMLPWYAFYSTLAFLFGACMGSFLNVCIYRIPQDMSVVVPRSHCPLCGKMIAWYHNIPIASFLALGARCHYCRGKISSRYFLVETLVASLFLLVWLKLDPLGYGPPLGLAAAGHWALVPVYWLVMAGLVLGTFVDFDHMIIPDRVTIGGIVAGLALSALVPALHSATGPLQSLARAGIGLAAGWGTLWLIGVVGRMMFRKDAMGFGDVKLMGAIGAFCGWRAVLFVIIFSSLFGSLVGVALVLLRKKDMQSRIPYGPWIALAAVTWILWGPRIWAMYIHLLVPPVPYVP